MTNLSHRMSLKDERIRNAHVPVPEHAPASTPWSSEAQDRLREAMMKDAIRIKEHNISRLRMGRGYEAPKGIGETARRCLAYLDVSGGGATTSQVSQHLKITKKSASEILGRLRNRDLIYSDMSNVDGRPKNYWYRKDEPCSPPQK